MGDTRRTSISFREEDSDVYEHLQSKRNKSQYVIDVIRREMKNEQDVEHTLRSILDSGTFDFYRRVNNLTKKDK